MKQFLLLALLLASFSVSFAQTAMQRFTISGYVRDAKNGEALIGATVSDQDTKVGAATNVYGFYSFSLPAGEHTIKAGFLGYETKVIKLNLTANQKQNIELSEASAETKEVVITAEKPEANVKAMEMSVNKLDIKSINKIPAFLGEVDVIRAIQLLPGVSTVGEGSSGFNVRGGSVDQNLVLLDEAPVYNSSHLFGFFSVFNPDAVKDVKLVKGGIPAQYGGRLSSLLDVRLKEGNMKRLAINGGVGTVFSRLAIEAPFKKDKGSFIVAVRRSYGDVFLKLSYDQDLKESTLYFYDLTAKANYEIGKNDRIYVSGYLGRDVFGFGGGANGFNWGNNTATVRWNHVFSDKLFLNATAFYSNYDYQIKFENDDATSSFNWKANVINYSIKPEFSYYLNDNTITFGGQSILYQFEPGTATSISEGEKNVVGQPNKYGIENALYLANEQKVNTRLSLQYGLRFSNWQYVGSGTEYFFNDTISGARKTLIGSKEYGSGDIIRTFNNLEPRFSAKYELNENSSIKASYNRTAQYIHLISNSVASTPLDIYAPSSNNIKPQLADQVAIGYFRNFSNNTFEASIEGYYKTLQNQLEYVSNADLLLNRQFEGDLIKGKGRAYGLEFFVKKNSGKLTGFISYTLSRSERLFEGLNKNDWYPTRFDKTHIMNITANYDITDRWSLGANFTYQTGTPGTFPTNRIVYQGIIIPQTYGNARNSVRIPDYHRLDFSATREGKVHTGEKWYQNWQGTWVFSVYNAYNRRNAFSIYFQQKENSRVETEAIRFAVFGSIIPAVTYNFKF
jgi:hypothetical protein